MVKPLHAARAILDLQAAKPGTSRSRGVKRKMSCWAMADNNEFGSRQYGAVTVINQRVTTPVASLILGSSSPPPPSTRPQRSRRNNRNSSRLLSAFFVKDAPHKSQPETATKF